MKKKRKQKRYYNPAEKRLVPIPVITDYFEPEPGLEYEDVPEELHARVAASLALEELEYFAHSPIGSSNIRKYEYGEARKHNPKSEFTLVIKRQGGFEHVYLTQEQVKSRLAQAVEMGFVNASNINKLLVYGKKGR